MTVEDSNTSFLLIDRKSRPNNQQRSTESNGTIDPDDLTNNYRVYHQAFVQYM
jgi:hypothetical protein